MYVTKWKGVGADDSDWYDDEDTTWSDGSTSSGSSGAPATGTSQESLPPGGFTSVNGICKATDSTMLGQMKELQRQCNRVLDKLGGAKIGVDGAIGAQTMAALATIGKSASAGAYGVATQNVNLSSCSSVAAQITTLTPRIAALADYLGASSSVSSPAPSSPPTIYNPITKTEEQQGLAAGVADVFNNMSTPMKIASVGIVGGIGYYLYQGKKRSR